MKNVFYCLVAIGLLVFYQNCSNSAYTDGGLTADNANVLSVENRSPIICPQLMCAAPPENCRYDLDATTGSSSCPADCGKLICTGPHVCPMLACAAPPPNCHYNGAPVKNADGCSIGCGEIVCDPEPTPEPILVPKPEPCPMIACRLPPANCEYDKNPVLNSNHCPIGCGNLICKPLPEPLPPVCPQILCAAPKPGCYFTETSPRDSNGCETGCGQNLVCDPVISPPVPPPIRKPICPMYACYLPLDGNCEFDGTPRLDSNGCNIGCGNLICTDNSK